MHYMPPVFTGLVEDVGTVASRAARGPGARLVIATSLGPLALGESVAVHGVCLTVDRFAPGSFEADCSNETLAVTTLGALRVGSRVHLERALLPTSRLGGHIVSGHVDGVGHLVAREDHGTSRKLVFRVPPPLARYVAEKGSIAIDGVSLTVNGVEGDVFDVVIIPHTQDKTTLAALAVGDAVNLETDILARYVARLASFDPPRTETTDEASDERLLTKLRAGGW